MISRRGLIQNLGLLALAAPLLRPLPAGAAAPSVRPAALTPEQQADLQHIQDYLNGIRTLASRFQQYSGDGGVAEGQLYLSRPGRMRFEYDPPVPILLVADGRDIHYYDKEIQQVSDLRVNDTPAGFLLRDTITLAGDVTVTRFEHHPGVMLVTVLETKEPGQGSVTLVLDDKPLQLRQWTVVDPQQKAVTITLTDPHYGAAIDPKLFYWTDPRPSNTGH